MFFSLQVVIISVQLAGVLVLLNFFSVTAKLAIQETRHEQMSGQGAVDVVAMFKGGVMSRLRVEHACYALEGKLLMFMSIQGITELLYILHEGNDDFIFNF